MAAWPLSPVMAGGLGACIALALAERGAKAVVNDSGRRGGR